jgi:hypothetical protein
LEEGEAVSVWTNIKSEIRSLGKPDFRPLAIKALLLRVPLAVALLWASPMIVIFFLDLAVEWLKAQKWLLWPWTAPVRYLTGIQDNLYREGAEIARQKETAKKLRALNEVDVR